jgi:uncharacterized membrane protein YkvA (DUF1232 family)
MAVILKTGFLSIWVSNTATAAMMLAIIAPLVRDKGAPPRLVTALVLDERMPASRKALLAGAAGYLAVGRDLVPDYVPVLGGIDDLVVVVLAVDLFLEGVPEDLLEEKLDDLGIDRAAFDRDIAQVRRLTPGPVRRTIRRVPGPMSGAGDVLKQFGLGPRMRAWITKEERGA